MTTAFLSSAFQQDAFEGENLFAPETLTCVVTTSSGPIGNIVELGTSSAVFESATSASLTNKIRLRSSLVSTLTISESLVTEIPLFSSSFCTSSVLSAPNLVTRIPLVTNLVCTSSILNVDKLVAGNLLAAITLSSVTSIGSSTLITSTPLLTNVSVGASINAKLTNSIKLSVAAASESTISATLTNNIKLASSAVSKCNITNNLHTDIPLVANASCVNSIINNNLRNSILLSELVLAHTQVDNELSYGSNFESNANSITNITQNLTTGVPLESPMVEFASTTNTPNLTTAILLASLAESQTDVTDELTVIPGLRVFMECRISGDAYLSTDILLSTIARCSSSATSTLEGDFGLQTVAECNCSASSRLTTGIPLVAELAECNFSVPGIDNIGTRIPLRSSVGFTSDATCSTIETEIKLDTSMSVVTRIVPNSPVIIKELASTALFVEMSASADIYSTMTSNARSRTAILASLNPLAKIYVGRRFSLTPVIADDLYNINVPAVNTTPYISRRGSVGGPIVINTTPYQPRNHI